MSRETLLAIDRKRSDVEKELEDQWAILSTHNVGLNDSLVDNEDYPRTDVNIWQIREARRKINCLQNDHSSLMRELEKGLEEFHSHILHGGAGEERMIIETSMNHLDIFAVIEVVLDNGPAYHGGLREHDHVLKFGSVTSENFRNMKSIADVVQHSKGCKIEVIVKRNDEVKTLSIMPQPFDGKGLLGCNILPYYHPDR